ncbi:hypothetical protein [Chryseobacterium gambrini]|uniref:hypothetical protein n=1 Tax=Chryseobacterium gambrini TaxID=373672 RepID=UPI003D11CCD4
MDYLAPILTFLAALVGIVGDTFDKRKKGLRKIKITGWIVIIVATLGLFISTLETKSKIQEIEDTNITKTKLNTIALQQINQSLLYTEDVFNVLYAKYSYDYKIKQAKANWSDKNFISYLSNLNLLSTNTGGFLLEGESWGHFISRQLQRTNNRLTNTLAIYAPYLSRDEILAIEELRQCNLFQFLPEYNQIYSDSKEVEKQLTSINFPQGDMEQFLRSYNKLKQVIYIKEEKYNDN